MLPQLFAMSFTSVRTELEKSVSCSAENNMKDIVMRFFFFKICFARVLHKNSCAFPRTVEIGPKTPRIAFPGRPVEKSLDRHQYNVIIYIPQHCFVLYWKRGRKKRGHIVLYGSRLPVFVSRRQ